MSVVNTRSFFSFNSAECCPCLQKYSGEGVNANPNCLWSVWSSVVPNVWELNVPFSFTGVIILNTELKWTRNLTTAHLQEDSTREQRICKIGCGPRLWWQAGASVSIIVLVKPIQKSTNVNVYCMYMYIKVRTDTCPRHIIRSSIFASDLRWWLFPSCRPVFSQRQAVIGSTPAQCTLSKIYVFTLVATTS